MNRLEPTTTNWRRSRALVLVCLILWVGPATAAPLVLGELKLLDGTTFTQVSVTRVSASGIRIRTADGDAEIDIPFSKLPDSFQLELEEGDQLSLGKLAAKLAPSDWENLVLSRECRDNVLRVTVEIKASPAAKEEFGLQKPAMNSTTILLSGAKGNGKQMAARSMATALGLDLYRVDLRKVDSKYIGETEKRLGRIFDAAQKSPTATLLLEGDTLFRKRLPTSSSNDRFANLEISYLLQRIESFPRPVFLSVDSSKGTDETFARRMRYSIKFPPPDLETRNRMWRKLVSDDIDFESLSRLEIDFDLMRFIAGQAKRVAAAENSAVTMRHLLDIARAEFKKLGWEFTEP